MPRTGLVPIATLAGLLAGSIVGSTQEPVPRSRLGEILGARAERATTEVRRGFGERPVPGRIVENTPGRYSFVPEDTPQVTIPIVNAERVSSLAVGPLLEVTGVVGTEGLTILSYELSFPSLRAAQPGTPAGEPAVRDAAVALNAALRPGAMSAALLNRNDASSISRAFDRIEGTFLDTYSDALERGDDQLRRETARQYREIQHQRKAIYGEYNNYPPWSYRRIFENAKSSVAIGRPGQTTAICSGVLVGGDLVMTAGHCFERDDPTDLEVWFDYAESESENLDVIRRRIGEVVAPSPARFPDLLAQNFGPDLYDFAILRFLPDEDSAELAPAGALPQCLLASNQARDVPLYVIGYPQGHREQVHDHGRVYLPFRLRQRQYDELRLEIEAEFADRDDGEDRMREFTSSYVLTSEGGAPAWELYHVRYGGQPAMGIVADTFRGNSGSPVYNRERTEHCVVGILVGGAPDTGTRLGASWEYHEMVLPTLAIVDELRSDPVTRPLVETGILTVRN